MNRCNKCREILSAGGHRHECPKKAMDTQVGGGHYKDLKIQPVEYIHANEIGFFEGNVIKYVTRWRTKNGMVDLEKAKHYIELLMELEDDNTGPDSGLPGKTVEGNSNLGNGGGSDPFELPGNTDEHF